MRGGSAENPKRWGERCFGEEAAGRGRAGTARAFVRESERDAAIFQRGRAFEGEQDGARGGSEGRGSRGRFPHAAGRNGARQRVAASG